MSKLVGREAISYLCAKDWTGSRLGLQRVCELLERIGNPEKKLRFVHIAGTNGKGSTAAMTERVLRAAGYRTGLYTSPYLYRFNERMQVNGEPISDEQLAELTDFIRPHAEAMQDHPTEFELITVLAFEYFWRSGCEIVALEVGLGGRLDATNVIETPEAAVITAIGLDHTAILGDTVEKIAGEKAGIIKPGGPVVLYRQQESVEQVIEAVCNERGAVLHRPNFGAVRSVSNSLDGQVFDVEGLSGLRLSLLGEHQLCNAAVVVETARVLRGAGWSIPDEAIRTGLAAARWPGRFELVQRDPIVLVDGGHNPQCVGSIARGLDAYLPGRKLTFLVGVLADKDYTAMLDMIAPYAERFVAVTPDNPRALPAGELGKILRAYPVEVVCCDRVADGVETALRLAGKNGAVCAFGSLYMTGTIRACFGLY